MKFIFEGAIMMKFEYTVLQLLDMLQEEQETERVEAKAASKVGDSIMQTVCAFANTTNGGYLVLGVSEPDEIHGSFWVSGVENADKLLNDLQVNCRDQFEQPIIVHAQKTKIQSKQVIAIYVPELDASDKPCTFKGKFDSKNKRKTGVWLRGINGDYEATQKDLEPIILAKTGKSYEQICLSDCEWEDLDPNAISRYRQLRQRIRSDAPELQADDKEMLFAMNLVDRKANYAPNIAGLLLFGKTLSLRRLLPDVRVDYVRVQGNEWQQDRFIETLDLREPLIYTIPKLESKILSDMPRHFRLEPNQLQRTDTPLLPQKVVRETIVNAVMHRDYSLHQPILVVRYDDRLEVKNAGYSLKPIKELGQLGSRLRNKILASVLYDINFAETKGSGIGVIRQQLNEALLALPNFNSDILTNQFSATYPFHQLLNEEQLAWVKQLLAYQLSQYEVMALVLAKENGQVNNVTLREVTDLHSGEATSVFKRLISANLLHKIGTGRASCYKLSALATQKLFESQLDNYTTGLNTENSSLSVELNTSKNPLSVELNEQSSELSTEKCPLPVELQQQLSQLGQRSKPQVLQNILIRLCEIKPMTLSQLMSYVGRKEKTLRPILSEMIKQGSLKYTYPEQPTHPQQAYLAT